MKGTISKEVRELLSTLEGREKLREFLTSGKREGTFQVGNKTYELKFHT